jgi:hypothetical protein
VDDVEERSAKVEAVASELERSLGAVGKGGPQQERQPGDRALAGAIAADEDGQRADLDGFAPGERLVVSEGETGQLHACTLADPARRERIFAGRRRTAATPPPARGCRRRPASSRPAGCGTPPTASPGRTAALPAPSPAPRTTTPSRPRGADPARPPRRPAPRGCARRPLARSRSRTRSRARRGRAVPEERLHRRGQAVPLERRPTALHGDRRRLLGRIHRGRPLHPRRLPAGLNEAMALHPHPRAARAAPPTAAASRSSSSR